MAIYKLRVSVALICCGQISSKKTNWSYAVNCLPLPLSFAVHKRIPPPFLVAMYEDFDLEGIIPTP